MSQSRSNCMTAEETAAMCILFANPGNEIFDIEHEADEREIWSLWDPAAGSPEW